MSKPPIPPTPAAYASDWKHFAAWCRRQNLAALPPDPEVVGPDVGRDQTEDGRGWIEILDKGLLVTLRGKTGCARSRSAAARQRYQSRLIL
jgi:hypothetical protein